MDCSCDFDKIKRLCFTKIIKEGLGEFPPTSRDLYIHHFVYTNPLLAVFFSCIAGYPLLPPPKRLLRRSAVGGLEENCLLSIPS